jgi:hypothetical protein
MSTYNLYMNDKVWVDVRAFFGSGIGLGFLDKESALDFFEEYWKNPNNKIYLETVSDKIETYYSCNISNPPNTIYYRDHLKVLMGRVLNFNTDNSNRYTENNTTFTFIGVKNEVIQMKRNISMKNLLNN